MVTRPKPAEPTQRLELISRRVNGRDVPVAMGLFDKARGEVTQVYPLDARSLPGIIPEEGGFRLSTTLNEVKKITLPDGQSGTGQEIIAHLPKNGAPWPHIDEFKHRAGLSITIFRDNQKIHKYASHKKLGYAITDDATGEILRYIPESQMRQMFNHLGVTKMRAGRNNNLTSLQLADGSNLSEKQFIDMLVGVTRAAKPRRSHYPYIAAAAIAASGITLMAAGATENRTTEAFTQAAAPQHSVQVIRRAPGADPMASYDAIQNPQLRRMVSHWFLEGAYSQLADQLSVNGYKRIESIDPVEIEALRVEAERLQYKMQWPVDVARAVDTIWSQDEMKMRRLGFKSPGELYRHALATARIESYYGEVMGNEMNPTVAGFFHFNDDTFMSMVAQYKREFGRPSALRGEREDILKLRNDPYWSTLMLIEYIKNTELGRGKIPGQFYRRHVLGAGGENVLNSLDGDTLVVQTSLRGAALDNGMQHLTADQVKALLDNRFQQGLNFVSEEGIVLLPSPSPTQSFESVRADMALNARDRQSDAATRAAQTQTARVDISFGPRARR